MTKELNRARVESKSYQLDLNLKFDEVNRLQKTTTDLSDLKEKFYATEQKLNAQLKKNQMMQDKLSQLQNELIAKGLTSSEVKTTNESTYENIIENLKFIIQEQFVLRTTNSQNDIDELKFKVNLNLKYLLI